MRKILGRLIFEVAVVFVDVGEALARLALRVAGK